MTNSDESSGSGRREWVDEAQEALDRTSEALRAAWDATRDTRVSALESAKRAAEELGDAIDKGVVVAKERWGASREAAAQEVATEEE